MNILANKIPFVNMFFTTVGFVNRSKTLLVNLNFPGFLPRATIRRFSSCNNKAAKIKRPPKGGRFILLQPPGLNRGTKNRKKISKTIIFHLQLFFKFCKLNTCGKE